MAKNLVIVESPAKAKTIEKILGKDFVVKASFGHVRDMPKNKLGFDTNTFEADYQISKDKLKVVSELKREIFPGTTIYLAADEDREGEAIAWHLIPTLKLDPKKNPIKRIVFHEITPKAIKHAVANPREIDLDLVNAQQARRILDRGVGYGLSPLLWKKIRYGLSAGRVQSVTTKIIVDKEREIRAFIPEEYWKVKVDYISPKFSSELSKINGKDAILKNSIEADKVETSILESEYKFKLTDIKYKDSKRNPSAPFTTSTLQQEASQKLGSSVKNTMSNAQALYEGNVGHIPNHKGGLITYMRTDSLNLSDVAMEMIKEVILNSYGDKYLVNEPRKFKSKAKGAQEAHEAIRPVNMHLKPSDIKPYVDHHIFRLYELIWNRTVATQMTSAIINNTTYEITAGKDDELLFISKGEVVFFDGFLKVYTSSSKDKLLPKIDKGEMLNCSNLLLEQNFTKPPARYSEASLVKKLEQEGIGRPSTYAPTITNILGRKYIEVNEDKRLQPTLTGENITKFLEDHFSDIVNLKFTSNIESEFDLVAEGKLNWKKCLGDFYKPFETNLKEKDKTIDKKDYSEVIELGINPDNKKPIMVKVGRNGPYIQNGTKDDEEKPKFAQVPKGTQLHEITLDMAISLLKFPKNIGDYNGSSILVNHSRFGPCINYNKKYYPLGEKDINTVTLKDAIAIIDAVDKERANAIKRDFGGDTFIMSGKYGEYIKTKKGNFKLPKDIDIETVELSKIKEIIEAEIKAGKTGKRSFKKKIRK